MAILNILHFPDPRLRNKAKAVANVDDALRKLVDDMFETMYAAPGIGLAATQVNVAQRLVVIDVTAEKTQPLCFINPEIIDKSGEEEMEEGCLSVPGYYDVVRRAERVKVRALDRNGQAFEIDTDGLLAVCIQHEIDHLDGKLFVDYLSELKRQRLRKKIEKQTEPSAPISRKTPHPTVI
jgi:peptide deformylase